MFDPLLMSDANAFRYFKLEAQTSGMIWVINEIRFVSGTVQYPIPPMTGPSSPPPLVVTASSNLIARDPYKAFDQGDATNNSAWISDDANPWIMIDFGANNLVSATAILITIIDAVTGPNNFAVKASIDGVNWQTKLTVGSAGWSASGEQKSFAFTL